MPVARVAAVLVLSLLAQDPTAPAGTPPAVFAGLPGIEGAAQRTFAPSEVRQTGTVVIAFGVARFADAAAAAAAMPTIVAREVERIAGDGGEVRPAAAPDLGDASAAHVGAVGFGADAPELAAEITAASLVWRDGPLVFVAIGVAIDGDPLADLVVAAERIEGREPGGAETTAADGMRSGGLWDVLPRPEDLPDGFVFSADSIPALFDALPEQGHEAS